MRKLAAIKKLFKSVTKKKDEEKNQEPNTDLIVQTTMKRAALANVGERSQTMEEFIETEANFRVEDKWEKMELR